MCLYKHFTLLERESLQVLLAKGISIEDIAKELGKAESSIWVKSMELEKKCAIRIHLDIFLQNNF